MPVPNTQASDTRANDFLNITDFSAGIVTNPNYQITNVGFAAPLAFSNGVMTLAQKPSAALVDNGGTYATYGCQGERDGSLGPLPYPTQFGFTLSTTKNAVQNSSPVFLLGVACPGDSAFYGITYTEASGAVFDMELRNTAKPTQVDNHAVVHKPTPPFPFGTQVQLCYINIAGTIFPTILYGYYDGFANGNHWLYSSNGGTNQLAAARFGWFFSHQGRLVYIENNGTQSNFSGTDTNSSGQPVSQLISFTDPPQTTTLGTQRQIFGQTYIDSFTTVGVLSSGELLMLTEESGGVVVSGDIFSPYFTTVPGVTGTGRMFGQSAITPSGMAYISNPSGLWAWNGGASAQYLSPQLGPNFWNSSGAYNSPPNGVADFNRFNVFFWNNWILCPDNFFLDLSTNAWWLLYPPYADGMSVMNNSNFYYGVICPNGTSPQVLVAFPAWDVPLQSRNPVSFQMGTYRKQYQWMSNSFQVSNGQLVDINEVVLTATNFDPTDNYQVTISCLNSAGTTTTSLPITVPFGMKKPGQFRSTLPHIQSDIIQLRIAVQSTNMASPSTPYSCIVNAVSLGFRRMESLANVA